jgi:hypothetical protein
MIDSIYSSYEYAAQRDPGYAGYRTRDYALQRDPDLRESDFVSQALVDEPYKLWACLWDGCDDQGQGDHVVLTEECTAHLLNLPLATLAAWRRDGTGLRWWNLTGSIRYPALEVESSLELINPDRHRALEQVWYGFIHTRQYVQWVTSEEWPDFVRTSNAFGVACGNSEHPGWANPTPFNANAG